MFETHNMSQDILLNKKEFITALSIKYLQVTSVDNRHIIHHINVYKLKISGS